MLFSVLFMNLSVLYFMVDLTTYSVCGRGISTSTDNRYDEIFSDDVDPLGYGGVSDDDHLSIMSGGSNASDGGVTITTWRHLSLADKQ